MPWAKIDDNLHANEKFANVSLAATGLWTLALSWTTQQLKDGFIPAGILRRFAGADFATIAAELVDAGLWKTTEGGYLFHDYLEYNPSAEKVIAEREAAKERMSRRRGQNTVEVAPQFSECSDEVRPNFGTSSPSPVPVPVPKGNGNISTTLPYTQHLPEMGQSQQAQEALEPIGSVAGIPGEEKPKAKTLPRTVSRPDSRLSCLRTVPRELASVAEWFESVFWKAYPRKESAPEAWKAIQSAFKGCTDTEGLQDLILGSLCAYKGCAQWTDATKIPHPATWLNRRPWEGDAPPVASVSPAPKGFAAAPGGAYRTPAQQAAHERGMSTASFFLELEKELETAGALSPQGSATLRTESRGH